MFSVRTMPSSSSNKKRDGWKRIMSFFSGCRMQTWPKEHTAKFKQCPPSLQQYNISRLLLTLPNKSQKQTSNVEAHRLYFAYVIFFSVFCRFPFFWGLLLYTKMQSWPSCLLPISKGDTISHLPGVSRIAKIRHPPPPTTAYHFFAVVGLYLIQVVCALMLKPSSSVGR